MLLGLHPLGLAVNSEVRCWIHRHMRYPDANLPRKLMLLEARQGQIHAAISLNSEDEYHRRVGDTGED